jgi:hypothetical protein
MAEVLRPMDVQFLSSSTYSSSQPIEDDPFRHLAAVNSHNHHSLHPWGEGVVPGSKDFDTLYAKANNKYMYHIWYRNELAPLMATEIIDIQQLAKDKVTAFATVAKSVIESSLDNAMQTPEGKNLVDWLQCIFDRVVEPGQSVFVRLGATSAKDSFAKGAPTAKPDPLPADADLVVRRFLTSGRVVGRLLALADGIWPEDPGEALIVQKWSPEVELSREVRVFCHAGRVTAISQDVWWEKTGWRKRYSEGFVQSITDLWNEARKYLPFDTCTMDVLMSPPHDTKTWKARIIEFNGFGAHLNTGSDLFHWVNDAEILEGKVEGITVRFVDDWEDNTVKIDGGHDPQPSDTVSLDEEVPDWLLLEEQLKAKYADKGKTQDSLQVEKKIKLPMRGRWCSAY